MNSEGEIFFDLMERFDTCGEADIRRFADSLEAESRIIFNEMSESRKLIMTMLAKLSDDEVQRLRDSMRNSFLVGFHDLNNELMILQSLKLDSTDK